MTTRSGYDRVGTYNSDKSGERGVGDDERGLVVTKTDILNRVRYNDVIFFLYSCSLSDD